MARNKHAFERRILAWSTIIAAVIGAVGAIVVALVGSSPAAQSSGNGPIVIVGQGQGAPDTHSNPAAMSEAETVPATASSPITPLLARSASQSSGHWIAQLASVPYSDGSAARDRRLEQIQVSIPQAQWLSSDRYGSLTAGFWVVYVDGPFADGAAAFVFCQDHGRTTETDCVGRFLSADPADHGLQCAWTDGQTPPALCYAKQSS